MTLERRPLASFLLKGELNSARFNFSAPAMKAIRRPSSEERNSWLDRPGLRVSVPTLPVSEHMRFSTWLKEDTAPTRVTPPQQPPARPVSSLPTEAKSTSRVLKTGTDGFWVAPMSAPVAESRPAALPQAEVLPAARTVERPLPSYFPVLARITDLIRADFQASLPKVLLLNRSRREAILSYLELLAGQSLSQREAGADEKKLLQQWIDSPVTPTRTAALKVFTEEVSLAALGQILVLKSWSDRGLRPFQARDFSQLNWTLCLAMEKTAPLDRENWQLLRQGLYSWYSPAVVANEVFQELQSFRLEQEAPDTLTRFFSWARQAQSDWPENQSWDPRFFESLWEAMKAWGFDSKETGGVRRAKSVFCPTLREGSIVRSAPQGIQWAALEAQPFQLLVAELAQLWQGPCAPPLWSTGTGLEVHPREQLSLSLGAARPSAQQRISEMDACDAAYVIEERCIRVGGRTPESQRLRAQIDSLPFFKKMREPGTSLGDLQAAVAIAKLRPGAMMLWVRQEPLSAADGHELLSWVLDRGTLVAEWDFSQVSSSILSSDRILPRYVYLFRREIDHQVRSAHLPKRIAIYGRLESHVEVSTLLQDAFGALTDSTLRKRAHWRVHLEISSTPQKEWADHWPVAIDHSNLAEIDRMRAAGVPLATLCTVRPATAGAAVPKGARTHGVIWVRPEKEESGRRLHVEVFSGAALESLPSGAGAFLIVPPSEEWVSPLAEYLSSPATHRWVEHHAERRADRWVLSEPVVKFIPVPSSLVSILQSGGDWNERLPMEWRSALQSLDYQPRDLDHLVDRLTQSSAPKVAAELRLLAYVQASTALYRVQSARARMSRMVSDAGQVRWNELLQILPASELMSATLHPTVQVTGNMPQQMPIVRISRTKGSSLPGAAPGLQFVTEMGYTVLLTSSHPRVIEMIEEQVKLLEHPTWSEVAQFLKLPRRIEVAEATANDILISFGDQLARIQTLQSILKKTRP